MLIPMAVIAGGCVLFGVANHLPLNNLIVPIIGSRLAAGHHFAGFPQNRFLVVMTVLVLLAAWLNHIYGVRKSGKGIGASDHIHNSPLLHPIYERAESRFFDPYQIGMLITQGVARAAWRIDRANDWLFNVLALQTALYFSRSIRELHDGSYGTYMVWIAIGMILMGLYLGA
jgi:NADH-quinone oxidoreductase subunit L